LPEFEVNLLVEARVAPSEEPERVQRAVENIVGDCEYSVRVHGDLVRLSSSDPKCLDRVHDQLRDRHIRSAARRLLLVGREGDRTRAMVNRQAAFHGVIALCGNEEESTLGPINLTLRSRQIESIIEWLTAYPSG